MRQSHQVLIAFSSKIYHQKWVPSFKNLFLFCFIEERDYFINFAFFIKVPWPCPQLHLLFSKIKLCVINGQITLLWDAITELSHCDEMWKVIHLKNMAQAHHQVQSHGTYFWDQEQASIFPYFYILVYFDDALCYWSNSNNDQKKPQLTCCLFFLLSFVWIMSNCVDILQSLAFPRPSADIEN